MVYRKIRPESNSGPLVGVECPYHYVTTASKGLGTQNAMRCDARGISLVWTATLSECRIASHHTLCPGFKSFTGFLLPSDGFRSSNHLCYFAATPQTHTINNKEHPSRPTSPLSSLSNDFISGSTVLASALQKKIARKRKNTSEPDGPATKVSSLTRTRISEFFYF